MERWQQTVACWPMCCSASRDPCCLPYTANNTPAGALGTLGARASAGMVLTTKAGIFRLQHQKSQLTHDDVIKWKHFPLYCPFVKGIHRSPVDSPPRPEAWSFDFLYDPHLNQRLIKQSRRRWLETPSYSLWRHCNVFFLALFTAAEE